MKLSFLLICSRLGISPGRMFHYPANTLFFTSARIYTPGMEISQEGGLFLVPAETLPLSFEIFPKGSAFLFSVQPAAAPDLPYAIDDCKENVYQIVNRITDLFDYYNHWESQLQEILNRDGSIQEYLDCSFPVFGNTLYVVDTSFKALGVVRNEDMEEMSAAYNYVARHGYLSMQIVAGMAKNNELDVLDKEKRAVFYDSKMFYNVFISRNIYSNGYFQGRLYINTMLNALGDWALELADHLGDILSLVIQKSEYFQKTQGNVYEHFVADVISGNLTNKHLISEQLSILGWNIDDIFCLLYIPITEKQLTIVRSLSNIFAKDFQGKTIYYGNALLILFHLQAYIDVTHLESSLQMFLSGLNMGAGISDSFSGFWRLSHYYAQAQSAWQIGHCLDSRVLYPYRDYVVPHLLDICNHSISLSALCHKAVFVLEDYDAVRNTEYYRTLKIYLECNMNQQQTAKRLFIHRNTLLGRLDRIRKLTSLDLEDYSTRFRLMLSYQFMEYQRKME